MRENSRIPGPEPARHHQQHDVIPPESQPAAFRPVVPPPNQRSSARRAASAPTDSRLMAAPDLSRSEEILRVRKKRKKHSARKAVLITLAAIVCVFGLVGGAAALYLNSINQALSFDNKQEADNLKAALQPVTAETKDKPFYMLVLGSDARESDEASRSDVIILTRVDPQNGTITMVSIPRDTMVELPGHGRQKINAAYAFDGAAGAVDAVSKFAGVPITHYAEIHFQELETLVDTLGGVWVNVPVTNDETGSSNTGKRIEAGEQLLNGEQALAFARERYGYTRGDFQRADNQRILAQAIVKKVLDVSPLELPGTVQQLAECVSTDYGLNEIIELAQKFQTAGAVTFYSGLVPSSTTTIDGISYVVTEYPGWTEMMQRVDAGEDPNAAPTAGAESSDTTDTASTSGEPQEGDGPASNATESL